MIYEVHKDRSGWAVRRIDGRGCPCRIGGGFKSRKEAVNCARLLAGWRGEVHISR